MLRLLSLLRGAGTGLALVLAFLPALVQGGSGVVEPGAALDSSPANGSGWSEVEPVVTQQAPMDDDDDVPGWVWAVVGGTSGAAIAVALGYKLWLGQRR